MPSKVTKGDTKSLELAVSEAATLAPKQGKTIAAELESRRDAISQALGKFADTDYFIRTVVIETQKNSDLLKCTPASLMGAVMTAAQLRLDFGPLGLAYVLPRWSNKKRCHEAQFQIGYRGLLALARSSGDIKDIGAWPVYKKDQFRHWRDENGEHLYHEAYKPEDGDLEDDRGPIVRYYGHAILTNGGSIVRVMELSDIARHRAFSESANSKYSPWQTNELAMSLKTCIVAMKAWLPLQPKDAQRLEADQQIVEERSGDLVVHRITPEILAEEAEIGAVDQATGEIISDSRTQLLNALNAMENQAQRIECSRYLREHFGRGADELSDDEVTEATRIVQGWPETKDAIPAAEGALSAVDEVLSGVEEPFSSEARDALVTKFGADYDGNSDEVLEWLDEWFSQPAEGEVV